MPRGAFLTEPAVSAAQLANQVLRSPVVARRYERHFGVPAGLFAQYARTQLGVRKLTRGGSYIVYHVKPDGTTGYRKLYLKAGRLVFVHRATGIPVLLANCGNPLSRSLPKFTTVHVKRETPTTVPDVRVLVDQTPPVPEPVLPPALSTIVPDALDPPELPPLDYASIPLWTDDKVLWAVWEPAYPAARSPLAPLLAVAIIAFVIPEPSTLAALTLGGVLLVGHRLLLKYWK